jgi:hypothetical protein
LALSGPPLLGPVRCSAPSLCTDSWTHMSWGHFWFAPVCLYFEVPDNDCDLVSLLMSVDFWISYSSVYSSEGI